MKKMVFVSGVLIQLITASILPATVPGRWEKVEGLSIGSPIVVYFKSGDRLETAFRGLTTHALRLDEETTEHPRSSIRKISLQVDDKTQNGALIGTGIGFGLGFGLWVAFEKSRTASGFRLEEESLGLALLSGAIGAGAGALAGWAIDRRIKKEEVLYQAAP